MNGTVSQFVNLEARIAALLVKAGVGLARSVSLCSQGANNRIHRVDTETGSFAVKEYFRHADDPRDRLAAETAFLRYANRVSPDRTPKFHASDAKLGMALVEFVHGLPLRAGEVGATHVEAAIGFFQDLNGEAAQFASDLPIAAEAAFSIADQLALIDSRIDQLLSIKPEAAVDVEALRTVARLNQLWAEFAGHIRDVTSREGLDQKAPQRCISPSDFGFHNALVTTGGHIRFVDFEYAGWDDSAKTAGDFFAQLAVPVPTEYFGQFVTKCTDVLPDPATAARRARLMRPAYEVKWCCIALNVFLPVHLARRKFANPGLDENALKLSQIGKAEALIRRIEQESHQGEGDSWIS